MVTSFLFFPEKNFYERPEDHGLKAQDVAVTTTDKVQLHGWFFEADPAKLTLLFFHGNAGNISGRLSKARGWVQRGLSVFLIDYRGYGRSAGKIEKAEDLLEDARGALGWLEVEKEILSQRIILYGESIGSYPAVELAKEKKFAGLILEAPFTTLHDLAKKHYGWVPDFVLKSFTMPNEELISKARAPVFILHGDRDEICPKEMGERLYELAPSPKEFYGIPGGEHNDLPEVAGENYFDYPYRFIAKENGFG